MIQPDPPRPTVHRLLPSPAGRTHVVESGTGPLVLLVHGFPESWYSWRHQLPALAAAGFRAVAVDVRGYGRSSRPARIEAYRMVELVADVVAVVRALGERTAVVVGHDWGATIAAHAGLLHPEVFRGVGMLSVPYAPRGATRPSDAFAALGGDEEFYVSHFQQPGRAEAEIEPGVRGWLAGFYAALSADTMPAPGAPSPHFVPPGGRMRDRFPRDRTPSWLGVADLDTYAGEFERTGMAGALARYRVLDRDWADLAAWDGAPMTRPALFVGGTRDASTTWMAEAIAAFDHTLPALTSCHLLDGCGHWVQQERPDEVNQLLLDWLRALPAPSPSR
ncbi:alpha/beta fold hydrolase [Streptomyces sp. NPDC057702]|uniref:alpha/beta fold hydrolase n=1 Tax=unclassified Streptomyces TaxID=2593676 RepID=UPI0036A6209C